MLYIRCIIAASRGFLITKHSIQVSRGLKEKFGAGLCIASRWWAILPNGTQYGMTFFRSCRQWPSELQARTKRLHYHLWLSFIPLLLEWWGNQIEEKTTQNGSKCSRLYNWWKCVEAIFLFFVLLVNNCISFWMWPYHISAGYKGQVNLCVL